MSRTPQISASAVHEARMILMQLLRHRQHMSFWSPTPKPAPTVPPLKCCRCFFTKTVADNAVIVMGGNSLCISHAVLQKVPEN